MANFFIYYKILYSELSTKHVLFLDIYLYALAYFQWQKVLNQLQSHSELNVLSLSNP